MTTDDGVTVYDRTPRRRKGERPAPRPLDALDAQVSLIDAFNSEVGSRLVEAMNLGRRLEIAEGAAERAAREIARDLNTATTVVVTDRMLDFVLDRMDSITFGDPLVPDDLLFEAAFIVLSRPVQIADLVYDVYAPDTYPPRRMVTFSAGFYAPKPIEHRDILRNEELMTDGIIYCQAVSVDELQAYYDELRSERDHDAQTLADIEASMEMLRDRKLSHVPVYSSGWAFGLTWDPAYREETYTLTPAGEWERRFWLSLLRTLKEEVFAPVRFRRAEQRRMERRGMIPDVVVADLRRVKHAAKEERLVTGETIMWSHRWRRRGHPRVLHRGTDKEKTVWVREHICGPESMPLIEKDRVYRLSK